MPSLTPPRHTPTLRIPAGRSRRKRPLRTAWAVVAIDESGHHASVRRSPLSANASVQLDPIRMPAPSTSAPPIITFPAAESGGTCM